MIKRCHLSSNFEDAIYLHTEVPDQPAFRLDLEFWFVAEILVTGQGSLNQWRSDPENHPIKPLLLPEAEQPLDYLRTFDLQFPASWVISAGRNDGRDTQLIPVPSWKAEIGKTPPSWISSSPSSLPLQ